LPEVDVSPVEEVVEDLGNTVEETLPGVSAPEVPETELPGLSEVEPSEIEPPELPGGGEVPDPGDLPDPTEVLPNL
ncbi:MAG: highly repetitive protein, partial [bacterium]